MPHDVIVVGDVLIDVEVAHVPDAGERLHTPVRLRAGGSALHAAVAVADRGGRALLVGRIGGDAASSLVRQRLAAAGIDARLAVDDELPTGTVVLLGSAVAADPGASGRLAPNDVPETLDAPCVLVSGYTLLQDATSSAGRAAVERSRARWTAVGTASRGLVLQHGLDGFAARAAGANVVFASEHEAESLTGLAPRESALALAAPFEVAVVTAGAAGAFAARGDRVWHAEPSERLAASPLGAGDAFAGAFLLALAGGDAVEDALRGAVDVARPSTGSTRR